MEAYTSFAQVYDMFMDNVSYEQWTDFIYEQLHKHGIIEGKILDLGCGTGKITRLLSKKGYDLVGVDSSIEMLEVAANRNDSDIMYLHQNIIDMDLYSDFKAAYSTCNCLNYILEETDLYNVFQSVYEHLENKGLFIFDLNTEYKYKEILQDNTYAENREDGSFIWDNYYDEESGVNEYQLALFIKEKENLYRKFEEVHFQKAYSLELIKKLLETNGFTILEIKDEYSNEDAMEDSEIVTFVAQKDCH
ncbi:class I SAM-dependent DNA methyltransferase [Lachnobacterium bovis]|uniref:Methyltransferase domain-containing protein n=1 Tax=Lachnobacterium bovis TaxID=140626 RepID=A0A1H9PE47_9FIRM|nr:class I SAM-dependent methyltransferase [Lachnobacterium bovis]SER46441.1 Methyltransferase domain-containing protein [Lachnobacterium bovis]